MNEDSVVAFLRKHRGAIIGALIGLVLCILWFTLGFWRTLLIIAMVIACGYLGSLLSRIGFEGIARFLDKIFK